MLAKPLSADANDFVYQWESSADYDPSENLERIEAQVLAINSAIVRAWSRRKASLGAQGLLATGMGEWAGEMSGLN
jgi:hypothetical protein